MLAGQPLVHRCNCAVRPGWPALPRSFFHFFGASGRRGGWGLGAGSGHHLASSPFILPTRGSATPMAATYCCTHYTEQTDRATHASAADASSPCRLSPLLKLLLAFFRVKALYLLPESLFSHTHCNSSLPTLGENQKMQDIKESLCVSSPRDLSGLDSEKISSSWLSEQKRP